MGAYQNYSLSPQLFSDALAIGNAVKSAVLPLASSLVGILISLEFIRFLYGVSRFDILKTLKYIFFLYVFADYDHVMKLIDGSFEGILQTVAGHDFTVSGSVAGTQQSLTFDANNVVANESFIISIAKSIMYFFRDIAKVILLAAGPIAICLGFIPGFGESIFLGWMKNYIHVTFWAFTFLILDLMTGFIITHMDLALADTLAGRQESSWTDVFTGDFSFLWDCFVTLFIDNFKETMACLALSLGYFFTPWLTNKYIGTAVSGGFIGRMTGTAMAAFRTSRAGVTMITGATTGNPSIAAQGASEGGSSAKQLMGGGDGPSDSGGSESGHSSSASRANSNTMKKNSSEN